MGENPFYQLIPQAPLLIVYFVGLIVALIYLGKAPGPAILTLAATIILLLTTVGNAYAFTRLIRARVEMGMTNNDYERVLMTITIIISSLRALAVACLLVAAFVGRRAASSQGHFQASARPGY